jgi:hypothetical protein
MTAFLLSSEGCMPDLVAEKADLQKFLDTCEDFVGYTVDPNHRETPDFLIEKGSSIIGVEHTQVFHRSGEGCLQSIEHTEDRIVDWAEMLYAERGGPPIDVDLDFCANGPLSEPLRKKNAEFIVEAILRSLAVRVPPVMERVDVFRDDDDSNVDAIYPGHVVSHLSFRIMPDVGYGCWRPVRAGWVMPTMIEQVYECIKKKDDHVESYRKVSPKCILLISGGRNPSSYFKFDTGTVDFIYPSRFDAVYLMHCFDSGIRRLRTKMYDTMGDHERLCAYVDARLSGFETMGRGLVMSDEKYADLKAKVAQAGPHAVRRFQAMEQLNLGMT